MVGCRHRKWQTQVSKSVKNGQEKGKELNIPLVCKYSVSAPYLSPYQRPFLMRAVHFLVKRMRTLLAQKQAVFAKMRAVLIVRTAFERPGSIQGPTSVEPVRMCRPEFHHIWSAAGTIRQVNGHYASILVPITHTDMGVMTPYRVVGPPLSLNKRAVVLNVAPMSHVEFQHFFASFLVPKYQHMAEQGGLGL